MLVLILRRVGNMILIMLAVSVVLFLLLEINGDSVAAKVLGAFSTDEQRRLWLEANGYSDPVYIRYFRWLSGFLNGNLGESSEACSGAPSSRSSGRGSAIPLHLGCCSPRMWTAADPRRRPLLRLR